MTETAPLITIAPNGKMLVRIHADGSLEYGEDYDPDKAAKVFWEALAANAPPRI